MTPNQLANVRRIMKEARARRREAFLKAQRAHVVDAATMASCEGTSNHDRAFRGLSLKDQCA